MFKTIIKLSIFPMLIGIFYLPISSNALEDADPPALVSFEITPTTVNTADEDQELTVTVDVTDDLTGVCLGDEPDCDTAGIYIWLRPLIGTQSVSGTFTRVSGDSLDGTYVANLTMPKWSKAGIWVVGGLSLTDAIGNRVDYDSDGLNALFPGAEGLTVANTTEETSVLIEGEWIFGSDTTTVTFPEGTTVTKSGGGKFSFYKMVNQDYNIEDLTDDGLDGDPVHTVRIGIPGIGLDFDQNVEVTIKLDFDYSGQRLSIQSLEEGAESWANESTCLVQGTWVGPEEDSDANYSECTFTVNHASYFSAVHSLKNSIVTAPGQGGGPQVRVFNQHGGIPSSSYTNMFGGFFAYDDTFRGGANVSACDVNGDGIDEIIAATGPGQAPWVRVYDRTGDMTIEFKAYADNITGGVYVACGDVDGDGKGEIVTGVPEGFGPHVRVFDGENGGIDVTAGFFAYASNLRTGIRVATGDLDGDGVEEIICGTGNGAGTHVRTFTGTGEMIFTPGFFVGSETERTGIKVSAGDIDGNGKAEIITASGPGKVPPEIKIYNRYGTEMLSFLPYSATFSGGVKVAAGDVDGDGIDEIITGAEVGGGPHVRVFYGDGDLLDDFFAYDENFRGGVDVAAGTFAY
ncbi:MAG: hypothetical protein COY66_05930 [Candidatus Kerfeldbacteria bacterium CG_4_10_14_0_8_um_filter_42_10]|uniref:VCBS repeat-containing protein n=1 Tax=Candidatus Kerfeldbacteria bacterium CG_4_10_14_0_8_um_filter_42_10 TaxID=2014248 RepID=A0A2M7RH06_9BACT|nr:MAG: hypothetical protein COY66_05930 [Candidatus Kerfeldbacteria bacterium CG_4_10_14_0_8_um_filter_42_10]